MSISAAQPVDVLLADVLERVGGVDQQLDGQLLGAAADELDRRRLEARDGDLGELVRLLSWYSVGLKRSGMIGSSTGGSTISR